MLRIGGWTRRLLVATALAVAGMLVMVPAASAVEVGWTWIPPGTYAKFSEVETSGIVQAGAGGAATYTAGKLPTPALKAAAAMLGIGLWLTAKTAIESADRRCMVMYVSVVGTRVVPIQC